MILALKGKAEIDHLWSLVRRVLIPMSIPQHYIRQLDVRIDHGHPVISGDTQIELGCTVTRDDPVVHSMQSFCKTAEYSPQVWLWDLLTTSYQYCFSKVASDLLRITP
jgi:hypothetical protein